MDNDSCKPPPQKLTKGNADFVDLITPCGNFACTVIFLRDELFFLDVLYLLHILFSCDCGFLYIYGGKVKRYRMHTTRKNI